MHLQYRSIGLIRSPFKDIEGMPVQPAGAAGVAGRLEIDPEYAEGLKDVDGFSHLIVLYHFHMVREAQLTVTPFLGTRPRGVFATRAPKRPNPLGLSVVKLVRREGSVLFIENVDVLDETPLLDVKPYVPAFDRVEQASSGWLEKAQEQASDVKSDDRFR
jgi:tRNA-Thr(GGU) m(6)t(6)A37 methyltransferase TsaA